MIRTDRRERTSFLGVIPERMRKLILNKLHATHLGIVKIKMFARSYVWWPGIDHDIKRMVKGCNICLVSKERNHPTLH